MVLIPLSADSQVTGRGGALTHDHRQVNLPAEALVMDAAPLLQLDSRLPNRPLSGATTARRLRDGRMVVAIAETIRPVRIVRDTLDSATNRRIDVTSSRPATRVAELRFSMSTALSWAPAIGSCRSRPHTSRNCPTDRS